MKHIILFSIFLILSTILQFCITNDLHKNDLHKNNRITLINNDLIQNKETYTTNKNQNEIFSSESNLKDKNIEINEIKYKNKNLNSIHPISSSIDDIWKKIQESASNLGDKRSETLDEFIARQESSVEKICKEVISSHDSYTYDEKETCLFFDACDQNLEKKLNGISSSRSSCLGNSITSKFFFGNESDCDCTAAKISMFDSVVKFADRVDVNSPQIREFLCITSSVRNVMRNNLFEDMEMKWQYIVSDYGAMITFPGTRWIYEVTSESSICQTKQASCPSFDPRTREWYISGSSPPKNIIILADKSGSLNEDKKMELLKDAINVVLDGLTYRDKLSVVFFDDIPKVCVKNVLSQSTIYNDLISATIENRTLLKECVNSVAPSGESNFENVFEYAFNLLDKVDTSGNVGCISTILLFTDGLQTDGHDPVEVILRRNKKKVKVFTFVTGSLQEQYSMKSIACNTGGLAFSLRGIGNLRTEMTKFYQLLAFDKGSNKVSWSQIFENRAELGKTVTASLSCHSRDGALLGVAGIDVPLRRLKMFENWEEKLQILQKRSEECNGEEPSESYTRLLRGGDCNYCDPSLCGPSFYTFIGLASVGSLLVVVAVAFLLSYIFFNRLKSCKERIMKRSSETERFLKNEENNNSNQEIELLEHVNTDNDHFVNEEIQTLNPEDLEFDLALNQESKDDLLLISEENLNDENLDISKQTSNNTLNHSMTQEKNLSYNSGTHSPRTTI